MMNRTLPRAIVIGASLAAAATTPFFLTAASPSQPQTIRPVVPDVNKHDPRPRTAPTYAAWIPPGTYSAIVLNSSGDERRWAVSLMTTSINVPVVVPVSDNVVIPFDGGWTVQAADEARLVSSLVPFDDSALYNKVSQPPRFVLSAWGITPRGPVEFLYREIKN